MKRIAIVSVALLMAAASLSGCMNTRAGRGAAVGGTIGAVAGGLGSHSLGGALVGGAIGAGAGYVIGKHSYSCRKTGLFGNTYWGTCLH
jgi:predicted small secreted protein